MFGWKRKRQGEAVELIRMLDTEEELWCGGAALISVRGKGALKKEIMGINGNDGYDDYTAALTLNGRPLVQMSEPFCPTCAGILAAGYGIEYAQQKEILETGERLNSDFISLEDSIERMAPLLKLLETGIYVVADIMACPTDGNGRFYWDIPAEAAENPASAASIYTSSFHCESGLPLYLYPTQGADRMNPQRVEYYREKYRNQDEADRVPRAVSYHICGSIGALLDGHHKACAAALEGKMVRCLTIIPFGGFTYRVEGSGKERNLVEQSATFTRLSIQLQELDPGTKELLEQEKNRRKNLHSGLKKAEPVKSGPLTRRVWEPEYIRCAGRYPDGEEYVEILVSGIKDSRSITDEDIKKSLLDYSREGDERLAVLLSLMTIDGDGRLKYMAMECIENRKDYALQKKAFRNLLQIKGDKEVEEFFIRYLVEEPVVGDKLRDMAYLYFEEP